MAETFGQRFDQHTNNIIATTELLKELDDREGLYVWNKYTAEGGDFLDYVVADDETAYPDGDTQDDYYYERVSEDSGVTNSVTMEVVSREGEIEAGTFANVDIEFDFLSVKQENSSTTSRTFHDVLQLDEDRYFIMVGESSANYANFVVYSKSRNSFGSMLTQHNSDGNSGVMYKMDDGRVLAITGASLGNTATVLVISIDDLTITFDATIATTWICYTWASQFYSKGNSILKQLAGNKFLYIYGKGNATAPRYAVVFTVEGNAINQGTPVVLNTTYQYMKDKAPSSAEVMDENHFVVGTCLSSSSSNSKYMPEVFFCSVNGLEITVDNSEMLLSSYTTAKGECLLLKTNANRLWLAHYAKETYPKDTTITWEVIKMKLYQYSNGSYDLLDETTLTEINGSWTYNAFRIFSTNGNVLLRVGLTENNELQRYQIISENDDKIIAHTIQELNDLSNTGDFLIEKLSEQLFISFGYDGSTDYFEIMPIMCIGTTVLCNDNFSNKKYDQFNFYAKSAFLLEDNEVIYFDVHDSRKIEVRTAHFDIIAEKYFTPSLPITLTKTKVDTTSGEVYLPA